MHFCHGWTAPQTTLGYAVVMEGPTTLLIIPDPFAGAVIPLRVIGRRIPARRYRDDADLRRASAAATPEVLAGEATGVR